MLNRVTTHIRRQLVGYLALAVALGGTAYAGSKVGGRDLGSIKERRSNERVVEPGDAEFVGKKCKPGERALDVGVDTAFGSAGRELRLTDLGLDVNRRGSSKGGHALMFNEGATPHRFVLQVFCLRK